MHIQANYVLFQKSKLPKDLQGLMGEANLKFARGEATEAIKMCMEIIRLGNHCLFTLFSLKSIYHMIFPMMY